MLSPLRREGSVIGAPISPFRLNVQQQQQALSTLEGATCVWNGGDQSLCLQQTAGEKRPSAGLFSQAKRHCSGAGQNTTRIISEASNIRKRTSVDTASNQQLADSSSKKAKTSDEFETEAPSMEICQEEPKPRDAAADVWNFIGVG